MVSLSVSGAGFLFYPRREREREKEKKSDFQAWRNKDTDELLWNYDLKTSETYHGYKGAQSLPFRGKSQMFLWIHFGEKFLLSAAFTLTDNIIWR